MAARTLIATFSICATLPAAGAEDADLSGRWSREIEPILEEYCLDCHGDGVRKGGLDFDRYPSIAKMQADRPTWLKVRDYLDHKLMPPVDESQPPADQRAQLLGWINAAVFPVDPAHPDPGHVVLRRLNRTEYENTLHDLLGIDLDIAEMLPPDDSGHGFDNIGGALTVSPTHLERYLETARIALDQAVQPGPAALPKSDSHRRIFGERDPRTDSRSYATGVLDRFARRAFRRPPQPGEIDRYLTLVEKVAAAGEDIESALRLTLEAMLVSPAFLFREEPAEPTARDPRKQLITEHALASRLSYFLWSSMPDEPLSGLADSGQLRANLDREIDRMLDSPRRRALTENFLGQWLQLRDLPMISPDRKVFPKFDRQLGISMRRETELMFDHMLAENLPLRTLLDSDYSFLDENLARHYGVKGVKGGKFRKANLSGTPRRGLLGQGSFLLITSHPTRTSLVLRGKFVLENLLDTAPPPPPPDVPEFQPNEGGDSQLSLRQQFERHRADPSCAACHAMLDPIGFGLENFDATGRWREQENGRPIDATGTLSTGEAFVGPDQLRRLLSGPRLDDFHRCVASKLLTYALGRGTEWFDKPAIDRIVADSDADGGRLRSMIKSVIHSVPFQYQRASE